MVVLALEKGWKPEDNIFNYVKFAYKLTRFTADGSETTFKVV